MQQNQPAAAAIGNTKKTVLIVAAICIGLAVFAVPFIFIASVFFMTDFPYQRRTAKAQPEIISISPRTWTESHTSGVPGKPGSVSTSSSTHQGFSVSYKFTTDDGQIISQTDDKRTSNVPSDMAQVCYEPKDPHNNGLQAAGKCP